MTTSTKSEDVEALAPLIMKALNWCDEMAGDGFEVPELVMFDMWQALGEPDGESCGPVIADTLRALIAERDALREASVKLHDDMLERARYGMDVIHGEQYRIVNAGNGAWQGFCAALGTNQDEEAA